VPEANFDTRFLVANILKLNLPTFSFSATFFEQIMSSNQN